ncbi:MAG: nitrite reductase large subunit NirB [Neomegalonema sp.]|nr:nitrite reductase large subunit NirB [Neomegalonema sp.]
MSEKLVVIGAGMASGRLLEEIFERAPGRYDVTLINAEPRGNYNRIMLSPVLAGDKTYEEIVTHDDAWYASHGVTTRFGRRVAQIDRAAKTITDDSGEVYPYDKLVIGTGSNPFIIPVPGHDLPGVIAYRDLEDTEKMVALGAKPGAKAVVIGGGLLGLEAAAGMAIHGVDVTVIHLMPTLMERQMDEAAGNLLRKSIESKGIKILTEANTDCILGSTELGVTGVRLKDGTEIGADLVCMAVGIRPNVALAKEAGLEVGRGILVDDGLRTSDPDIYAVGECVEHRGAIYGLVAPLYEMAKVLGAQFAGDEAAAYLGSVTSTKLKVTGCDVFSAGDFADAEDREEIVFRDASRGVYKRLVLKDNKIIGAVMFGDTADGSYFFQLLKDGEDISEIRDTVIFGPAFAGGPGADPLQAVAALPLEAEICGCNGVCKGTIVDAITSKGLTTLAEVQAHTKASSSCGTCTGLVEQLMAVTLGESFEKNTVTPMCGCTDLTHMDVRKLIVAQGLKSIPDLMQALEWKTSCGCAKCRPALNYYMIATWPGEAVDDNQSRFINERVHANIQKDGTYSVVPRMWGGVTTADELRAIADVCDKYQVPTVKVTGGQRIDMLGIKKEDLPGIWADLGKAGFVSGHAYAKGLRTVKTCVGKDWCRFGTQDSTGLGIKLEKALWGSWTPAKVKLAVSGCPRNCAEATCKDIGVVCVDSGYEISFAGAAGLDVKETEFLCKAGSEEEAMEIIEALLQLYREEAQYLHRMYKWLAAVGMEHIQAKVVEDLESRKALRARFRYSQSIFQVDPWEERAAQGKDAHEFKAMAEVA